MKRAMGARDFVKYYEKYAKFVVDDELCGRWLINGKIDRTIARTILYNLKLPIIS